MDNMVYFVCIPNDTLDISEANSFFYDALGIRYEDSKKNSSFLRFILNPYAFYEEINSKKTWALFSIEVSFLKNQVLHSLILIGSFKYDKFFFYGFLKEDIKNNREFSLLKEEYKAMTNQSRDVIFEYDLAKDTIYFPSNNKSLIETKPCIPNYKKYLQSAKSPFNKADRDRVVNFFDELNDSSYKEIEVRLSQKGLKERSVIIKAQTICSDNKNIKAVGLIYSCEEEKKAIASITEKTNHDFLTGVLNLDSIKSLVNLEIREKNALSAYYALLLIDLDNFRDINNRYGISFADDILINSAKKISNYFGSRALIGRSCPNQFVVFIPTEIEYTLLRMKSIQICKMFRNYVINPDTTEHLSVSIGISRYPFDGKCFDDLFSKADMALYMAKTNGKDGCFLYVDDNLKNASKYSLYKSANKTKDEIASGIVFDNITKTGNIEKNILEVFEKLKVEFSFDKIVLLEKDGLKVKALYINNLEEPFKNDYNEVLNYLGSGFVKRFNMDGIYIYSKDTVLGELEKELYRKYAINSFFIIGLEKKGHFDMAISFFNKEAREYPSKDVNALKKATEIIRDYLYKFRLNERLVQEIKKIDDSTESKNSYSYIVDKTNFDLIDFDSSTALLFPDAKRGNKCYKELMDRDIPCDKCPIMEFRKTRVNITDYYLQTKRIWVSSQVVDFELPNGVKTYLVHSSDISTIMRRMTSRDSLTGLLTISSFVEKVQELVSSRSINKYAIVYFDINRFKIINEVLGYTVGDQILIYVSRVLTNMITESELLFRISGDQFVLLLKYESVTILLSRLESMREVLRKNKLEGNYKMEIAISGGVFLIDARTPISMNILDLANVARRIAKKNKESFVIYDDDIDLQELKKKEIEKIQEKALQDEEFIVYIHPKVNIKTNRICGGEALIRWYHNGYVVPPNEFIPIFEENGFVINVDHYVYETIFKLIRYFMDNDLEAVTISMNASSIHFSDPNFIPTLKALIDKYQVPTKYIEIELTESLAIDCSESFYYVIRELKSLGFTLSLDDFGSGYSSLNVLSSLPVDVMKLDKGFFDSKNEKGRIIVESVVNLANSLGIKALAEGIETSEQVEFLKKVGCNYVQGYFYYKPMPLIDFVDLLKKDSEKNDME